MQQRLKESYIGIDVGGTTINAVGISSDGHKLERRSIDTLASEGIEPIISKINSLIENIIRTVGADHPIKGLGVAFAGVVNMQTGYLLYSPNFPGTWRDVALGERLKQKFSLPVFIINDARAATFGEKSFGAGQGSKNMVMVTIGTGIGGGIIINEELYFGSEGYAGEIGHQTIESNGPLCGCGNHGCLEAMGSGPAIASMAIRAVKQGMTTVIRDLAGNDLNQITPKLVADAAYGGDVVAVSIIKEVGASIGTGIANLIVILNPDTIVIGGGVANAGSILFEAIEEAISRRVCILPHGRGGVRIVPAQLGEEAGAIGAAAWAMHQMMPI